MIPILGKLAQYPYDHHVTGRACLALAQIGPEAKAAIPALLANLKAQREVLGSARALVKIGVLEGEQALREMLDSPKREERLNAAYALWELKRDPKGLAELCDNGATHPDYHTRRHALMTLGQIELKADEERELLLRRLAVALDDEQPYVQKEAARALARLGPEAAPTVRPLMRLLKSDSWSVADQAARTLGALGPTASKALPELRVAADNPLLRPAALEAINNIER